MNRLTKVLLVAALMGSVAQSAILLNIPNPDKTNVALNTPLVFVGFITNDSGVSISNEDIFFSFSGFTPGALSLSEIAVTPFVLANGATSPLLNLFSATLLSGSQPALTYSADVTLQDIQGDLAPATTVSLSSAPEPGALGLVLLGIGTVSFRLVRGKDGQ